MSIYENKIETANKMLKHCIYLSEIPDRHWIRIDFEQENRFIGEVCTDKEVDLKNDSAFDLCKYTCCKLGFDLEQVCEDEYSDAK